MSYTKRLYNYLEADEPYLYEDNPYKADIEWNIFMAQQTANQRAKLKAAGATDNEDIGYHGLRSSDL